MAGTTPNPVCIYPDTRSSQPNQASCTPDFLYQLVFSRLFSSSSPISLLLVHNSTIIAEHTVMPSLSISPCRDHELTPSTAFTEYSIHQVQHTPSTAHTEYSIHRVQHTPSTAYTEYSIHRVQHTPSTAYTKYSIHRVQHTPSTAYNEYSIHRVQHTPSTAYTEYSIHPVQHTLSTPCTHDYLSSLRSHNYELTPARSFSFQHASLHDQVPSPSS